MRSFSVIWDWKPLSFPLKEHGVFKMRILELLWVLGFESCTDGNNNNAGCLFSASFDHGKTLSALLTIFTLLSFHQFISLVLILKFSAVGSLCDADIFWAPHTVARYINFNI